nr:MAG TPA: Class III signal peptide [Caudoviricetes sp.]
MPLKGGGCMEYLVILVIVLVLIERILDNKKK